MKIAVLCGGLSTERDVSLSSGACVARALREKGHKVLLIDMFYGFAGEYENPGELYERNFEDETYAVGETAPAIPSMGTDDFLVDIEAMRAEAKNRKSGLLGENVLDICREADIAFLALHGDEGENGCIQAVLDVAGIRYTGAGCLGSAAAMNKHVSKALFRACGVPTPKGVTVKKGEAPLESVGFPCVVKPCSGGSSLGISIVMNEQDYKSALGEAFQYEDSVIVEQYIKGRELTVGIMGDEAMPVVEIIPRSGFYDYKNKYQPGLTLEICPAEIGEEATLRAQRIAMEAHRALMLDVYSRADIMSLREDRGAVAEKVRPITRI